MLHSFQPLHFEYLDTLNNFNKNINSNINDFKEYYVQVQFQVDQLAVAF